MPEVVSMTNRQHVSASLDTLDIDKQPITELPPGASVVYLSDHPEIADFEEDASGIQGEVTSGINGVAVITGTLTLADGKVVSDTLTVTVTSSAPGAVKFRVGIPVDET